ncbi:MAG TPA: HU family DNA-binding protein [Ignavibacteria bacterium]|nr:HU family DNA-binding protein [Ignavibacteria bacterium]HMR41044.1 HU family DNA-binding protein [Ignavibacteria bacterium]
MLKQDIVKTISKESKLKRKKSSKVFDLVFEMIAKDLKKKKSTKIENFGEFRIIRQKMKIESGKKDQLSVIPPKDIVNFKTYFDKVE